MRTPTRTTAVVGALVLLASEVARADTPARPEFVLDYAAPEGCPDRDAFVAAIRARTPRPQLVSDAQDAHDAIALHVAIEEESGASASGRLELRESDGTEEARSVSSRTCGEVASALALVAALMLDPEALAGPVPPPAAIEAPSPPPERVPPPPTRREPRRPAPAAPRPSRWHAAAGAELGVLGGIGPAIAPMAGAFVDVERGGAFVSSARLGVDAARTSSDLRGGSHTYEWVGATLRVCPMHVPLPGPPGSRLVPCAGLQIAGYRGTTSRVHRPDSSLDAWIAPLVGASLVFPVNSSVSLEAGASGFAPLRRTRFFLAPSSTIFEVPAISATASLGASVRFR